MDSYMMPYTARQIITGQCYSTFQILTWFYTQQYLANTFQQQRFQVAFTGCLGRISFRSVNIRRFCTVFLNPSRQVRAQYLKSNHSHFHILAISVILQSFPFFFICIYYFQPVFYRLGMSRGIYSVFSFTHLHYICSFLAALVVSSYFVVFNFPGAHLEVVWRWFLEILWCRRCLYGTEETAAVG